MTSDVVDGTSATVTGVRSIEWCCTPWPRPDGSGRGQALPRTRRRLHGHTGGSRSYVSDDGRRALRTSGIGATRRYPTSSCPTPRPTHRGGRLLRTSSSTWRELDWLRG